MIGNTLLSDWTHNNPCNILTQSSATLNLNANQAVAAAYLYWSSVASPELRDLDVALNGTPISAQRILTDGGRFAGFADVTNLIKNTGNGTYLFSDFDAMIPNCYIPNIPFTGNYAGWAIVIVYEDPTLTGRMVNIYDGLEYLSAGIIDPISINLDRLNMTDTKDAKFGFVVWNGSPDSNSDELRVNGNVVSNTPLNPVNNIYNSTNTYTGSNTQYKVDLDYFDISNYISVNDTSINIETRIYDLGGGTSAYHSVVPNVFALTLINQQPDATLALDKVGVACDSRDVQLSYTVFNTNASGVLPANTPIAFYANGTLVATTATKNSIAIKGSETGMVTLNIPATVNDDFVLTASVDDDGTGKSSIDEINEDNNTDTENVTLKFSPEINTPEDIIACDENGTGFIIFDLAAKKAEISTDTNVAISFHETREDAENGVKSITNTTNYQLTSHSSMDIWVRAENKDNKCAALTFFTITAQMKPFNGLQEPLMLCNLKNNHSTVNLTHSHFLLSKMYPYMGEIDFKFYETESNAESEINEITNINNYQPFAFPHVVWIKAKGKNNLWCEKIFQLQLNDCIVPKGISPNGDSLNDGFDIAIFNPINLKIFNRYGIVVYEHGIGYTNQWHGQDKNNKQLPSGTYYYSFNTLFDTYVGYVYVIREIK